MTHTWESESTLYSVVSFPRFPGLCTHTRECESTLWRSWLEAEEPGPNLHADVARRRPGWQLCWLSAAPSPQATPWLVHQSLPRWLLLRKKLKRNVDSAYWRKRCVRCQLHTEWECAAGSGRRAAWQAALREHRECTCWRPRVYLDNLQRISEETT